MSILIIGTKEQDAIDAAMKRARERPITIDMLAALAVDQTTTVLTLADRKQFKRPRSEEVLLPTNYRLAISYEEQPAGLCAHMSLSVNRKGMLPNPAAFAMAMRACGFDMTAAPERTWIEEFTIDGKSGGVAMNAVWVVEPRQMQ
jgi:hypothetical protein